MNIVVLSDTHGFLPSDKEFFDLLDEVDRIYHLGDGWGEIRTLEYAYGSKLVYVGGNNDPVYGKDQLIDDADGTKILLTHGHTFGVRHGLDRLLRAHAHAGGRYDRRREADQSRHVPPRQLLLCDRVGRQTAGQADDKIRIKF